MAEGVSIKQVLYFCSQDRIITVLKLINIGYLISELKYVQEKHCTNVH